ncbi:MAG TPA: hypothetical protein VGZ26_05745, partial [Pirellulales bacterium]|nr:hypothetical protein [Pirellulales bacterium]
MVQDLACRSAALLLSVALASAVLGADPPKDDEKPSPPAINVTSRRQQEEATLEHALDQVVSADFRDATLGSLPAILKQYHIEAVLDAKALGDAGMSGDTQLPGLQFANISLRSVLSNLFRQIDLEFVNRNGRLLITTADVAANELQAKVYLVEDLLHPEDAPRKENREYTSLIDLIEATVFPQSWDEVGGPGSIGPYQGTLLISQTYRVHQAIDRLLAALRENRDQQHKHSGFRSIWVESPQQIAALDNFQQKASLRADFKFDEAPLADAVTAIAAAYNLSLMLDAKALGDAGIAPDTPITADVQQVSPEDLVDMVLRQLEVTIVQAGEVIWITTQDVASNELAVAVYPIADLVHAGPIKVGSGQQDFRSLAELITASIRPTTWSEVGGPGSIEFHPVTSSLVIDQTREVHAEISRLLAGIREIRVPPTLAEAQAAQQAQRSRQVVIKTYPVPAGLDGKTVAALVVHLDARSWNRGGHSVQLNGNQLVVRHT